MAGQEGCVVIRHRRVIGWSPPARRLLGLPPAAVLGAECAAVLGCAAAALEGGCPLERPSSDSFPLVWRDERGRPVPLTARVALREADGTTAVLIAPAPPHRRSPASDLDPFLAEALAVTGAEAAEVFLRASDEALTLAAFRGLFPRAFRQITRFPFGEGYPGLVAATARPLMAADAVHDPRYLRRVVQAHGFRYYLCVPIPAVRGVAGSLHVAARRDPQTVLPHLTTLERLADHLGEHLELRRRRLGDLAAAVPPGEADPAGRELRPPDRAMGSGSLDRHAFALAPAAVLPAAPAPVRAPLELFCLGPFQMRQQGTVLDPGLLGRRRALAVLQILLTRYGSPVHREELAEALWPQGPPADAAALLKVAVHYLRRGLATGLGAAPEYILTQGPSYAFNAAAPHHFDVADFQEQLLRARRSAAQGDTAAAADAYRRAIACYHGDFLADEPYAEWSLSRREELAQLYLTALSEATDVFQRGGAWEESLRCCRVALARDPCREDFHRALMQLLWRLGRRAEALRQYRECAAVLDRELGVGPDPATQALGRRIAASP